MFTNLTRNEFIALLFIQAAEIDFDFAQEEKAYILTFVDESKFIHLVMMNGENRLGCYQFLKSNFGSYFPTEESRAELKAQLLNLFLIDKSYNQFERTFMEMFREKFIAEAEA